MAYTNVGEGRFQLRVGNDFSNDTNCVALYNFESGALTADSKLTNTLTASTSSPTANTADVKQGTGCADFEDTSSQCFYRADADLTAGFPLKSGDTAKNISVCAWVKAESLQTDSDEGKFIFAKGAQNKMCLLLDFHKEAVSGHIHFMAELGFNGGASTEKLFHQTEVAAATWYHVTFTYQNSDKAYALRIRDASGAIVGTDLEDLAELDAGKINAEDAALYIGALYYTAAVRHWDGLIDEVVIFKDVLTEAESTKIAKGAYP